MYRFSIHEIALFGRFFGRGSTLANKNTVWKILEGLVYLWKRHRLRVSTFGPTLTPLFPLNMAKIHKNKQWSEKLQPLSYPICQNEVFISSPFSEENTITFAIFGIFLRGKRVGVTSQRSRIKVWQILFYPHDSWSTSCKKVLDQIFPSFAATDHKGHFRTWIFKFGRFSWYHFYIV